MISNLTIKQFQEDSSNLTYISNDSDLNLIIYEKPKDGRRKLKALRLVKPRSSLCLSSNVNLSNFVFGWKEDLTMENKNG